MPKKKKRARWIQRAIRKPGALKEWFKREYGDIAFTAKNTIKLEFLKRALNRKDISEKTKKRIRLALTLRKLRKRKK